VNLKNGRSADSWGHGLGRETGSSRKSVHVQRMLITDPIGGVVFCRRGYSPLDPEKEGKMSCFPAKKNKSENRRGVMVRGRKLIKKKTKFLQYTQRQRSSGNGRGWFKPFEKGVGLGSSFGGDEKRSGTKNRGVGLIHRGERRVGGLTTSRGNKKR